MIFRHILLVLAAVLCMTTQAYAATVKIEGSATFLSTVFAEHREEIEKKSGHTLKIISKSSEGGVRSVNSGDAQIGMISVPLKTVIQKVNKIAPGTVKENSLIAHNIGEADIAFTTHKSNNIKSLTRSQLTDILTGKIKKWSEVGGPKFPFLVITEKFSGGLRTVTEQALLGGESIKTKMKEMPSALQIPKIVEQAPAALGIMPTALVSDGMNVLALDEGIKHPLFFVTKGQPTKEAKAVIRVTQEVMGLIPPKVSEGVDPLTTQSEEPAAVSAPESIKPEGTGEVNVNIVEPEVKE